MILDWAEARGISCHGTHLYRGDRLPEVGAADIVVVMGGPMGVHDEAEYPWLRREKTFLLDVLQSQVPILGICLGAQLIAAVLGAKVVRCPYQEMGYSPVKLTREAAGSGLFKDLPQTISPLHWHGETFTIPEGGIRVAGNDACMNQGFVGPGPVLALQFHLEATPELAYAWLREAGDTFSTPDAKESRYIQNIERLLESAVQLTPSNRLVLYTLLDRFCIQGVRHMSSAPKGDSVSE